MFRPFRWLLGALVLMGAATAAALPTLDAAAFIVRAADVTGPPARLASWRSAGVQTPAAVQVPTRFGDVPGRIYAPARASGRTIVLVPGVHRDGIDEARLVALARDFAESGLTVVTVAAPDLQRFRITPDVTDVIEDAVAWTAAQPQFAASGGIGVVGISFSGGLAVVAAGRERIRDHVAFVVSFGGHGDLWRVLHYLTTGQVIGDMDAARRSKVVLGADTVMVHPPHDYGLAVVLLTVAADVVPPEQVRPLVAGVEHFLLASSLDMVDKSAAAREFAGARDDAAQLPEPARTLLGYVNDRDITSLGARLAPVVDRYRDHPGMRALSAEQAPGLPSAPVYLLHGSDDNVIPSIETVLLGEYLDGRVPVHGLLSSLITHAEMNRTPTASDVWRLASFWRDVFGQ